MKYKLSEKEGQSVKKFYENMKKAYLEIQVKRNYNAGIERNKRKR